MGLTETPLYYNCICTSPHPPTRTFPTLLFTLSVIGTSSSSAHCVCFCLCARLRVCEISGLTYLRPFPPKSAVARTKRRIPDRINSVDRLPCQASSSVSFLLFLGPGTAAPPARQFFHLVGQTRRPVCKQHFFTLDSTSKSRSLETPVSSSEPKDSRFRTDSKSLTSAASAPPAGHSVHSKVNQHGKRLRSPQVGSLDLLPRPRSTSDVDTASGSSKDSSADPKNWIRRPASSSAAGPSKHQFPASKDEERPAARPRMSPAQGSYFGLSLPPSKDMAEPATPFFTPSAFPATPNPHHQQQQHTNTSNSNAGFFAALQRRNAAESPTSADATPKRPAFQLAQTPSAVDPCSSSSGATPFFSDLSIHQNSQSHKPAPSNGTHHNSLNSGGGDSSQHPSSTLLRRTSSASALPAPQPNTPFNKSFMSVHYNGNANKRPSTASSASPSSAASFPSVAPADLQPEWFLDQRASTLVLDLRTHSNYMNHSSGRFRGSINLCVPTTLLRRPNHNLSKLADTVPEQHHREALLDVLNPATCIQRVIAVDQDSVVLAPSGPLYSILSKVSRERENAQGSRLDLFWLKGGMGAAAKEERLREANVLVWPGTDEESDSHSSSEASLPSLARTDSDTSDRSTSATSIQSSDSNKSVGSASTTLPPILQVRSLPMAAFDNTSTQQYRNSGQSSSGAKPHGALVSLLRFPL